MSIMLNEEVGGHAHDREQQETLNNRGEGAANAPDAPSEAQPLSFDEIDISIGWTTRPGVKPVSLARVFEIIRTGELIDVLNVQWPTYGKCIEGIRANYAAVLNESGGDTKAARKAIDEDKKKLANAMFAGDFGQERKLEPGKTWKSSGLVCLDFDCVGSKLDELSSAVRSDPHVVMEKLSPSGDGLKVVVRIPPVGDVAQFKRAFGAVWNYAKQTWGTEPEFAAEPNKMCYVSFDPDIYTNATAIPLDVERWALPEPEKKARPASRGHGGANTDASEMLVRSALEAIPVAELDEKTWATIGMCLHNWDDGGDAGFLLWDEWSNDPTDSERYDPKATDSRWLSWTANPPAEPVTVGTLFKIAKDFGWKGYVTPSEWVAFNHPGLVEKYGQAFQHKFVERAWKDAEGNKKTARIWTPTDLNERMFAALLVREGNNIDPAVFDQDENRWLRYDPAHGHFAVIRAEALHDPLERILRRIAAETRHFCVDTSNLEFRFQDTRTLNPIIQKASGLCTVHADYWKWPTFKLPVKNGVLDIGDQTLMPHSPDNHFRGVVNVKFDPGATWKRWMEFLERSLPDDDIDLLQRFFGLVLVGRNVAQKMLILSGTPQSGKGVIARVLTGLIGPDNVGTLRTSELEGRFELSRLRHKMLIYGGDVPADFLNARGARTLKAITGEDPVSVEFKGSNVTPAAEPIYGSVLVTANSRLKVRFEDDSEAWRRRIVLIPFERASVAEGEQVIALDAHLLNEEGAGILNWALEGLRRLDADGGKLQLNERQQAIRDALIHESESYVAFAREGVIEEDGASLGASEAYEAYVVFCHTRGWTPLTLKRFGSAFKESVVRFYGVTQSNDHFEGRGWHGIRLHRSRPGRTRSGRRNPLETLGV